MSITLLTIMNLVIFFAVLGVNYLGHRGSLMIWDSRMYLKNIKH